jgi:hypothetical protein
LPLRTAGIAIRVPPDIKAAVQKAADDDRRTVSSLIEKVLAEWLTERSYLTKERDQRELPLASKRGAR